MAHRDGIESIARNQRPCVPASMSLGLAHMAPSVSILLPVFNGGHYLAPAVESLLAQTHKDFEIIAIDDGSTDASLETLRSFQARDPRVRIVSRENRGLIPTLNEGLALAQGRFVARMDADDISYPERLALQLEMFAAHPGAAMCGTGFDTLFADRVSPGGLEEIYETCDLAILARFYTIFIHSTVMFDRAVLAPGELRYDTEYPHAEDFDLFRRIANAHKVVAVRRSLVGYRLHDTSVSTLRKQEMRRTHVRIVAENFADLALADLDAMRAVVDRPAVDTVARLVVLFRALEDWIGNSDPAGQRSWREGFVHLFYFFYRLLRDECDARLVRQFIQGTRRSDLVRRRERLVASSEPWLGDARLLWRSLSVLDAIQRHVTSRPFRPQQLTS
jgi:glycosyltransferase involved in cell wall biosynthesis